jgi:ArsR family transcriptional regulator, arsenate/arsenite/antimonite-responsive transcriptional repressor
MELQIKSESQNDAAHTDVMLAADLFALAHPVRLAIVRHLASASACCNKDVVGRVGLAQSTVSQHLKILVDAGLVNFEPDRQRSRYSLNHARLGEVTAALESLKNFTSGCCANRGATIELRKA